MNRKTFQRLLVIIAVVTLAATSCSKPAADKTSAAPASVLSIGQAAPEWVGVLGIDGKPHGLADYKDAKVVALVFTCNHCPVAKAYEDRLIELKKNYEGKGVELIAVNVSPGEADKPETIKKRAEEKGFNFVYLHDPTQKMGRDYGATVTPHVFVLDKDRKVAYMGAIDDNQQAEGVKTHFLRDAIDALLDGRQPPKPVTKQFGCGIQYEDGNKGK